jgi:hypothetical protein
MKQTNKRFNKQQGPPPPNVCVWQSIFEKYSDFINVLFLCNSEQNGGMKSIGQFVYLFEGDNY